MDIPQWHTGHGRTTETITVDSEGSAQGELKVAPGLITAGVDHTVVVSAGDTYAEQTVSVDPAVKLTTAGNEKIENSALNSTADIIVTGLPENATVTFVGVGDRNLLATDQTGVSGTDLRTMIANLVIPEQLGAPRQEHPHQLQY
ncbi:hypothetical protein [Corynebacterium sp. CCM 9204]|uniref:hypothetical protein n=1 Tax=Corynebacterium sp. CCM 9204 TaxID=3057616 RepID=UPI0035231566